LGEVFQLNSRPTDGSDSVTGDSSNRPGCAASDGTRRDTSHGGGCGLDWVLSNRSDGLLGSRNAKSSSGLCCIYHALFADHTRSIRYHFDPCIRKRWALGSRCCKVDPEASNPLKSLFWYVTASNCDRVVLF
jgi:hypothetical protein